MKFLFAFVLVALATAQYTYIVPEAPCKWGMTVDAVGVSALPIGEGIKALPGHSKMKVWVFGSYQKMELYNHNDDLIGATISRSDFMRGGMFMFGLQYSEHGFIGNPVSTCQIISNDGIGGMNYASIIGYLDESTTFAHADDAKYNGQKCIVYYDNDEDGEPDRDSFAVYVDSDGYVIGITGVKKGEEGETDIPFSINYTYHSGSRVRMSDFSFSRKDVFGCPDERVYSSPSSYFAHCAASTTHVFVAVVVATLLAALAFVF